MQSAQNSAGTAIRVLVADDTRIHTQLLADALRRDSQLEVINPPARSRDLLETIKLHKVNVVVVSSNLDEEPLRGFELLRELRAFDSRIFAIMLLDSSKRETVLQAFHAGARGIFSRLDSVETLSRCIRSVHEGQIWANSQQLSYAVEALASLPVVRAVDANGLSLLSKREMDVVRSLAEGLTNREIAERLGLSQHTIKNYLFRVYDKLGVSSRLELLFMTLTQNGASPVTGLAPPASRKGNEDPLATKVAIGKAPRSEAHGATDLRFPAASVSNGDALKLQKESERTREAKRGSNALISTDPLD